MRKLIQGILEFRKNIVQDYRETFARLALEQHPDCLFIACSDSRVVPNLFASTNPGDLFVMRNVGNLVAPCRSGSSGLSTGDVSEAAAVEFALGTLRVRDVIVCGHGECGAMRALCRKMTGDPNNSAGAQHEIPPNLDRWLANAEAAFRDPNRFSLHFPQSLPIHDQVSQRNVLVQLEHLMTYPIVKEAVEARRIRLHGWWFDIGRAEVYSYEAAHQQFMPIDEEVGERILQRISADD